jgi:hypothetical protein
LRTLVEFTLRVTPLLSLVLVYDGAVGIIIAVLFGIDYLHRHFA